jgi:hypothetical protein
MYNISWLLNHPQALGRQCLGDRHLKAKWANKTGSTLHGQPLSGSTRLEQIWVRLKPGYSQVKLADHHVPIKPVTGTIPRFQKHPFAPVGDFPRIAKNSERDHTPKRRLEAVQPCWKSLHNATCRLLISTCFQLPSSGESI